MCADIKRIYWIIFISEDQRDFRRIFRGFSFNDEFREYRLNTVTYGVSCSPFLALRSLHQFTEGHRFPLVAKVLQRFSCIDDFVFGAQSLQETKSLRNDLLSLLKLGEFELHKWCCNHPSLLGTLPPNSINPNSLSFDSDDCFLTLEILGLQWNPIIDSFTFSVQTQRNEVCTERSLLSELARVYDPLRFLTPPTFLTKFLIQKLWILGLNWDENVPSDIDHVWS